MKNVHGCLINKNCQLKLSTMTRNTFNILRGKWYVSTVNRFL